MLTEDGFTWGGRFCYALAIDAGAMAFTVVVLAALHALAVRAVAGDAGEATGAEFADASLHLARVVVIVAVLILDAVAVNIFTEVLVLIDVSCDALVAEVVVAIESLRRVLVGEEALAGRTLLVGLALVAAVDQRVASPLEPFVFLNTLRPFAKVFAEGVDIAAP